MRWLMNMYMCWLIKYVHVFIHFNMELKKNPKNHTIPFFYSCKWTCICVCAILFLFFIISNFRSKSSFVILQEQNTCVAGIFIYYSHTVTNVLISNSTKLSSSSITWIDHQRDFHWNCFSTIVVDQGHYIVSVIRLYYGEAEAGWFELYVCCIIVTCLPFCVVPLPHGIRQLSSLEV